MTIAEKDAEIVEKFIRGVSISISSEGQAALNEMLESALPREKEK